MPMFRESFSGRPPARLFCRALLLLAAFALIPPALAQPAAAISPSVVLVLKLVSATLVKPTTGIVVSDDGMVLVPAEFAAQEGEMIVLDGGADIASNGRPAKLVDGQAPGELALLSVKGLKRPGIARSGNFEDMAGSLHLEAFPPAEEIAKGARPLSLPASFAPDSRTGQYAVSADTPLPYVTGAILDGCGRLAGVSLASGPQSLDSGQPTTVLFGADLVRLLDAMQIELPVAVCERQDKQPETNTVAPVVTSDKPPEPAVAETPAGQETATGTAVAETAGETSSESPPPVTAAEKPEPQPVRQPPERPSIWQHVPAWLVILVLAVAGVLAWKVVYFLRLRPHSATAPGMPGSAAVQPASDEPETAPLEDTAKARPRSAPALDFEIPENATRPAGCDGLLLVEGRFDEDTSFKRFCFVDTTQVDVVIGRGDADIAIEHAAISRSHARIRTDDGHLTFSDLGSRNGSFIGDVPCMAGEEMYVEPGAEIFLGDVRITLAVVKQEAEWA